MLELGDCSDEIAAKQERYATQTYEEGDSSVLTSWTGTHRSNQGLFSHFFRSSHSFPIVTLVSSFRWSMWSEKWIYGQRMRFWSYSVSLYLLVFQFLKAKSESFGFHRRVYNADWNVFDDMFLLISIPIGNARESWERLLLASSLLLQGALKCLTFFKLRISLVQNMEKNLSWFLLSSVPILVSIVLLVYLGATFFLFSSFIYISREMCAVLLN